MIPSPPKGQAFLNTLEMKFPLPQQGYAEYLRKTKEMAEKKRRRQTHGQKEKNGLSLKRPKLRVPLGDLENRKKEWGSWSPPPPSFRLPVELAKRQLVACT
jgi:hypothetical protein